MWQFCHQALNQIKIITCKFTCFSFMTTLCIFKDIFSNSLKGKKEEFVHFSGPLIIQVLIRFRNMKYWWLALCNTSFTLHKKVQMQILLFLILLFLFGPWNRVNCFPNQCWWIESYLSFTAMICCKSGLTQCLRIVGWTQDFFPVLILTIESDSVLWLPFRSLLWKQSQAIPLYFFRIFALQQQV